MLPPFAFSADRSTVIRGKANISSRNLSGAKEPSKTTLDRIRPMSRMVPRRNPCWMILRFQARGRPRQLLDQSILRNSPLIR